jgi:hypothetical protein
LEGYLASAHHVEQLIASLQSLSFHAMLDMFIQQRSDENVNFSYWWSYMDMVSILLHFTCAQRDGLWELHLQSFSRMLPYYMRYDHQNYGKWGAVYLADMNSLPQPVLQEFEQGNFVVKRSARKFNQVDVDHGQEWLIGTGKTGGGIVRITKTNSALSRWALSYNLRSTIAAATHAMFGHYPSDKFVHNESTPSRQKRDQETELKLLALFKNFNVFSRDVHPSCLHSICTKDLASDTIQESLLNAKVLGKQQVTTFVEQRLVIEEGATTATVPFTATLKRNKGSTLESLYDVSVGKTDKEKKVVWKADRNVMQRLITAYEGGRQVDLETVMKHELMPMPLSIAQTDGSLQTGTKSVLAELLTIDKACPDTIQIDLTASCMVIDGMALVSTMGKPSEAQTFGDLADKFVELLLHIGHCYIQV